MKHYFVIKIYRYQKFSLIFIFSTNFILLIYYTFLKTKTSSIDKSDINLYQYVAELLGSSAILY